jgi:hypothetical protein
MHEHDNADVPTEDGKVLDLRKRHGWRKWKPEVNRPTWLRPVARGVTLRTCNGSPILVSSTVASFQRSTAATIN